MIHVHKRSGSPLDPWGVVRTAGPNTIAPGKGKYLILWDVHSVRHGGQWHYVLDFEPRDTTDVGELARLMGHKLARYPDGPDWAAWLGDGWEPIDEHRRWKLLHPPEPPTPARNARRPDVRISVLKYARA